MDFIHSLEEQLQMFLYENSPDPQQFQSAAALLQGLKDGELEAFRVLGAVARYMPLDDAASCELTRLLVPYVLREDAQLQPGQHQHQHQQLHTSDAGGAPATPAGAASSGSELWWAAVEALVDVWRDHDNKLDQDVVLQVLHRVLQGLLQHHQQQQHMGDDHLRHEAQQCQGPRWLAAMLLTVVRDHDLTTEVLQHSGIMSLMVAAVNTVYRCPFNQMVEQLLRACPLPLRELPAAHGALCHMLASGSAAGGKLMSIFAHAKHQAALGLWQDPALQAACLEGARRAAAAVREAVVASRGRHGGADGSASSFGGEPQVVEASKPHMPEGLSLDVGARAMDVAHRYAWGMLCLLEGRESVLPSQGSVSGADLVAAAWQCLVCVIQWLEQQGVTSDRPGEAARRLLRSAAARQVLFQEGGAVCSLEEVCGVLGRCLTVDNSQSSGAVEAVLGLLEEPGVWEAALAVPGFAEAVVAGAFGPADMFAYVANSHASDRAPLLGALVSHEPGRAALLHQHECLGQVACYATTLGDVSLLYSPHLAQLWAAGTGEGLAGAMVAGLAAGEEGWVQFFGWVVKERPAEEWCELPGLPAALAAAFAAGKGVGLVVPDLELVAPIAPTLEKVLVWLLKREQGQQLLSSNQELAEEVGASLQFHATRQYPSPLAVLLEQSTPGAAGAMACMAASPVLFKGALVSLVTCRGGEYKYDDLVEGWVVQVQQLQQQVLGDRGLLCALLRAAAAGCSALEDVPAVRDGWGSCNTSASCVLQHVPADQLLPQLLEVLEDVGPSGASSAPAAAGGMGPDALLAHGAWLAIQEVQERSTADKQLVLEAMQRLARDAGRVRVLQEVEAAGHAAWVAAAQARQEVTEEHQQLQREREAVQLEKQQLQQEKELLEAERQQLEQLKGEAGQERKRRQLG